MRVDRLASSAEELEWLQQITARPGDLERLRAYAGWLDARGDPRGAFLRALVAAIEGESDLPEASGWSAAWLDCTGWTILKTLAEADRLAAGADVLSIARPALLIEADPPDVEAPPSPPSERGTTRLGGDPDLATDYPCQADGRPLYFLGQINLEDVGGTVVAPFFPADGLLSIFRTQTVYGCACFPEPQDWPRLVRRTPPEATLRRVPRPAVDPTVLDDEGNAPSPLAPYRSGLRLRETLRLPVHSYNGWLPERLRSASGFNELADFGAEAFTLLGHVAHANTGADPLLANPDRVLLLLLPSSEGPDLGMNDSSLSFHLPADDLVRGVFDQLKTEFG